MDSGLLHKIDGSINEISKRFYENLASLPRRTARDNRRGKLMKKIHQREDKEAASKIPILKQSTSTSSVRSKTSTREYQSNSINSTSEMDRLEARSKAAKLRLTSAQSTDSKRVKLSANENPSIRTSSISVQKSATKTPPKLTTTTKVISSSSEEKSNFNHRKETSRNESSSIKTQVNSLSETPKGRKKLKRNSFLPPSQPACKVSKC